MPSVIGSYRVEGVIGQGGMGVVYRATQISLDRPVALKVIAPQYAADPTFRERFRREWQLAATLEHPNVVAVYELGEDQGIPYSAMRLVNGPDLRRVIEDTGPLAPERAVAIVEQIAGAIDAAHARGLVHRDIKPANILLEHTGRSETAYLTDFGVVKRLGDDQNLTGAEGWVGSLNYVTPEQVQGETVTPAADIYGLGAVLFTMLTGAVPFQRADSAATLYATVNEPTPLGGLPPHLAPVVDRAMAKDPTRRYPSAGDLADAARSALSAMAPMSADRISPEGTVADTTRFEPIARGPITPGPALRRPQRRWSRAQRRGAAAATGAVATVAALSVAAVLAFGGGPQPTPKAASSTSPTTTSATDTSATSAASTSATTTRQARITPATTEPASTAPATTAPAPPASTPPASTPQASTPQASTPQASTPQASTPQAATSLGAFTQTGTGPVTFDYDDNVNPGTMTLAVTGVVRQGPFARVDLTVRCDTPGGCDTAALEYPSGLTPLEAVELVDPVHEQFHLPVEDNDHHLAVSSLPFSDLAYHHRYDAWVTFAAPPVTDPDVEILLPDAGAQILDVAMPTEPGRWTPPARAAAFDQPATSTDATNLDLEVGPISGHSKPGTKAPTPGNPATFTISGSSSDDNAGTETYKVTTAARRIGNLTEISGTVTCLRTTENDPCSTMHDFSEEISTDTADGIDLVNYRTHTTYFPADGSSQAAGGTLGQGTGAGFGFDLAPGATESFFNWYVTDAPGELAAEFPNGGPTLKQ